AVLPEATVTPTRPTDTARDRTRRMFRRWWWVWLAVLAVTVVGLVNQSEATSTTALHPRNPGPDGTMAAAEILRRQGVEVITVTTLPDALAALRGPSTLLVANLQYFSEDQLGELARVGADVVVVGNPYLELGPLTDAVAASVVGTPTAVTAQCGDPDATAASRITASIGGVEALRPGVEVCFPTADGVGAYAVWEQSGHAWRYLADGALMTNELLAEDGNAALTLRALGHNERLVWLLPTAASATVEQVSPMPPAFTPLTILAAGLVLALALWRGRHLGRVVVEPLPVVVKPGEAVLGRAQLYRRTGAASHAGAALRAGTARRLARRLGLPRSAGPDTLVPTVAAAAGRDPREVVDLLYHRSPTSNTELLDLSAALDTLEREVHRHDR
ncbi:MAG: DUF4350 domain-containing protein, partial [Actinomycetota bacterium]